MSRFQTLSRPLAGASRFAILAVLLGVTVVAVSRPQAAAASSTGYHLRQVKEDVTAGPFITPCGSYLAVGEFSSKQEFRIVTTKDKDGTLDQQLNFHFQSKFKGSVTIAGVTYKIQEFSEAKDSLDYRGNGPGFHYNGLPDFGYGTPYPSLQSWVEHYFHYVYDINVSYSSRATAKGIGQVFVNRFHFQVDENGKIVQSSLYDDECHG